MKCESMEDLSRCWVVVFSSVFVLFFEWHLIFVIEFTVPSSGALLRPFFFCCNQKEVVLLVFSVCVNSTHTRLKIPGGAVENVT